MASTLTRRPLPALIALVALLLLTGLVWWRVLHRSNSGATSSPCPSTPTSAAPAQEALPAPSQVTVQVLNSTDRAGIAGKARTTLVAAGFNSPQAATNDSPKVRVRGVAEIRYATAQEKGARLLSFYFPGATLVPNNGKSTTVVVSLGARYVRVADDATVRAALAKQHLTTVSPTPTPSGSPSC